MSQEIKIALIAKVGGEPIDSLLSSAEKHDYSITRIIPDQAFFDSIGESGFFKKLLAYRVVYYRSGLEYEVLVTLKELLGKRGIPVLNAATKHFCLNSKSNQALLSSWYGIKTPKTLKFKSFPSYEEIVAKLRHPFVVKPNIGTYGDGVELIRDQREFEMILQDQSIKAPDLLFQEYVESPHEYRFYTVGGKVIGAYMKTPVAGEFRANLAKGSRITKIQDADMRDMGTLAEKVSNNFGVEIAAIDFLRSEQGIYFLEINLRPGCQGAALVGLDINKSILEYLHEVAYLERND